MRRRRDPVPRAKDSWIWLGGLALLGILGGGVTAAAVVLWENIDIRQLAPALAGPTPPLPLPTAPDPAVRDAESFPVILFDSPRNAAYFPDPAYYRTALGDWRSLITNVGGEVRTASTVGDLQRLTPGDVLVLAETPCLSEGELAAIRAHLRRGGSIVTNWAVGARDAECEWRGWEPVAELTGAEDVREISTRDALFFTVPAGVALSPGFDPGSRIELRPEPSLALRLPGARVYWSDWALNPAPEESGGSADVAAMAARTPSGGRAAWFGHRLAQGATPADSLRLRRLVENGVLWAAGVARASPAAWPGAARAALVLTLDVEDEPRNALEMATLLRDRGIPGTFFPVSGLVQEDGELAAALSGVGEVGSQTSDHATVAGLTAQDQRVRLRRSWVDIERWVGIGPRGLRPPEERFDLNTLEAWAQAGGTYLLAGNEGRSGSPELYRLRQGAVVLLPRVLKDDYNIIVQDRVIRASGLTQALLDGTRKLHAIGGLAVVAGHTQIMRTEPRLAAIRTLVDSAQAQGDWWIAEAGEVAAWWRARAETELRFVAREPSEALGALFTPIAVSDLVVAAPADRSIEALWIEVLLPRHPGDVVPIVDGRTVDFVVTEWGVRVPLPPLAAGQTLRVSFVSPRVQERGTPSATTAGD